MPVFSFRAGCPSTGAGGVLRGMIREREAMSEPEAMKLAESRQ